MNENWSMDNEEFDKCMMGIIVPLWSHARDRKEKRVMVKTDSGPGRLGLELVARLCLRGFYLYPGVPNTTAVSQ